MDHSDSNEPQNYKTRSSNGYKGEDKKENRKKSSQNSSTLFTRLIDEDDENGINESDYKDKKKELEGFDHPESIFKSHPAKHAGILSKLFFWWAFPVVRFGRKNQFKVENLGKVLESLEVQRQLSNLQSNWDKYLKESTETNSKWIIFKALARTYRYQFLVAFLLNFIMVICNISMPLLIAQIVSYMQKPADEDGGILLGIGLIACYIVTSCSSRIIDEHAIFKQAILGDNAFSAMIAMVYSKTLKISSATNKEFSQGEIINFIQVDSEKLCEVAFCFPPVSRLPIQLIFCIAFLVYHFGYYLAAPLVIGGFMSLCTYFLSKWLANCEEILLQRKDKRMNTMTEVINSIKILKLNAWVKHFINKITTMRNQELKMIKKCLFINTIQIPINFMMSPMLLIATFGVYFYFGNTMSLANGFACMQVLYSLEQPIRWIPEFLGVFMEFVVSMKRIQRFLLCDEINPNIIDHNSESAKNNGIDILIENANFSWGGQMQNNDEPKNKIENKDKTIKNEDELILNGKENFAINSYETDEESKCIESEENIKNVKETNKIELENCIQIRNLNLKIFKGEFVCIIGEVGSGKSSLLSAILGDMIYLDQEMVDKFRDQVIDSDFRHKLNNESLKHKDVIKLGGSISFVQQIPWIQSKTIRENILFGLPLVEDKYNKVIEICQLASDLEILSGGDLTEIGEKGINLSGGQKARVSLARAVYADKDIILMDDPISALDSNVKKQVFDQVLLGELKNKTRVLVTHAVDFIDRADRIIIMEDGRIKHIGTYSDLQHSDEMKHMIETLSNIKKNTSDKSSSNDKIDDEESQGTNKSESFISSEGTNIIEEENNEKIEVGWNVYYKFFVSNKNLIVHIFCIPLFVGYCYFILHNTFHIGEWIEASSSHQRFWFYIILLTIYPACYTVIVTSIFVLINMNVLRNSKRIHEEMLSKTMNAPINLYFDKTPSGRILNRFSKDIRRIDNIGHQVMWGSECFACGFMNCFVAVLNTPWVLLILPVMFLLFGILIQYYMKSYRDLSRLESVSNSPIITHLGETLNGVTSIRAYKKENTMFINSNHQLINKVVNVAYWENSVRRWFSIKLEIVCSIVIIFTSIFLLSFKDKIDPILIGALFVHVMWISIDFLWGSQGLTELEGRLVGFDRCLKVLEIPQEANQIVHEFNSSNWPKLGNIEFRNFYLKYRPETELVLKNLSFSIKDNEKIGVVGRTGAGKSTLCLALCRIVEAFSGTIFIDGVDISQIGLEQLREKITIIPQDPTLFNGSLRFNLDPQGIYSDEELLELISQAALDKLIERDNKGLDQLIEEHGQNLSSGEKQLLCICRAILKKNKVVLMDEATANIDIKTEQVIQRLIKEKFKDSTVITIAHRLNTIINSDKVLVLSKGEVSEFDSPQELLKDSTSIFYSYVNHLK